MCNKKFDVELVLPEGSAAQASRNAPSTASSEKSGKPASSEKSGKPAPPPSSVGELQKPEFVSPSSFASNEVGLGTSQFVKQEKYTTSPHSLLALPSLADGRLPAAVRRAGDIHGE